MRLSDLLSYQDIVIQCHDNPDADALACGAAMVWYFQKMNHPARFIYRGRNEITKSNLRIMIDALDIPVSYEPDLQEVSDLLITVDCQYGERNVTTTNAPTVATIDHHQVAGQVPALSEIRSNLSSCSTIIWDMLRDEGLDPNSDKDLATALYYGLFTDSNRLSEVSHPLDRDMVDGLNTVQRTLITKMCNSNISLTELHISGQAILDCQYFEDHRYMLLEAEPCDPNILGVISDFALETDSVDVCLAYYIKPYEIKLSVRSCIKEVHANELAAFLTEGIGGGGGHITKAGGSIRPEKLEISAKEYLTNRMAEYFQRYSIMYAKDTVLDTSDMKVYEKLPQEVGTVCLSDLFPPKTKLEIRTLEGDVSVTVEEDTFLMIGIEGEVYPINRKKLLNSYRFLDRPYSRQFEYAPSVKDISSGEKINVMSHAQAVISNGGGRILARPLTQGVKLFTAWDEEKYYLGNIGDYIAVRAEDEHDIYLIKDRLFPLLYKEADSIN
ncbi:MAG: DHH family phosphoesterase [Clostridiales bacterium]|nr:DHH family phosphoesterase [Candidatus Scatonaster coprocaballi]